MRTFRCLSLLASLAVIAAALTPVWAQSPDPNDPTAGDEASGKVARLLRVAYHPREMRFGGVGILWLKGAPDNWKVSDFDAVKRWAARGHVAWIDVSLAQCFGVTDTVGAGTNEAFVLPDAQNHPLATGVQKVECMDSFRYMRGLPAGCQPVISVWNRENHVVVAAWPMGKGLIVFRPEARPNTVSWEHKGERRWIEPDLAEGGRFLHNLNMVSLAYLENAGFRGLR